MLKRCLIYILAATMLVGMTGCGKSAEEATTAVKEETVILPGGGTNTVYVITKDADDAYSTRIRYEAGAVIEEAGYVVKTGYHEEKEETQTELFQKAVEQKAAAILCSYTGTAQIKDNIQTAKEAGIPVFLIGEPIAGTEEAVSVISVNPEKAAQEAAKALTDQTGGSGVYAVIGGTEEDQFTSLCKEGFQTGIKDTTAEITSTEYTSFSQKKAQKAVASLLSLAEDSTSVVNGILCINDEAALGAANAVKQADMEGKVWIVSVGGSNDIRNQIKKEAVLASYVLPVADAGKTAGEQTVAYLTQKEAGESQTKEGFLMTAKNASQVKNYKLTETKSK